MKQLNSISPSVYLNFLDGRSHLKVSAEKTRLRGYGLKCKKYFYCGLKNCYHLPDNVNDTLSRLQRVRLEHAHIYNNQITLHQNHWQQSCQCWKARLQLVSTYNQFLEYLILSEHQSTLNMLMKWRSFEHISKRSRNTDWTQWKLLPGRNPLLVSDHTKYTKNKKRRRKFITYQKRLCTKKILALIDL